MPEPVAPTRTMMMARLHAAHHGHAVPDDAISAALVALGHLDGGRALTDSGRAAVALAFPDRPARTDGAA